MKLKKMAAAVACAAACVALMPGVASADDYTPSYNGNVPSYNGGYTPSYNGNNIVTGGVPSYNGHAPSAGYVDGAVSAPVNLGGGVTVNVIGHGGDIKAPAISDTQASNTKLNDGWFAPAPKSLVVEPTSYKGATSATLIFNFGDKYDGAEVKVFAQHEDGTADVYTGSKVADKLSTVEIDKFSVFTVAVKAAAKSNDKGTTPTPNKGKKSPNTAVSFAAIAEFFSKLF